jgi:hypothetical protein
MCAPGRREVRVTTIDRAIDRVVKTSTIARKKNAIRTRHDQRAFDFGKTARGAARWTRAEITRATGTRLAALPSDKKPNRKRG